MQSKARIATVCTNNRNPGNIDGNRQRVLALLDHALLQKPDLVCLPEAFPSVGVRQPKEKLCEPLPGPTTDIVAARAKDKRCNIVCSLLTKRDGTYWNSAVVIDRTGNIAGVYDKLWPVTTTPDYTLLEDGLTPGHDIPVFDLDIGRIGIQICFDLNFREDWRMLGEKGAKLVLWPSAYNGGFPLRAYASLHQYYVMSSVRSNCSQIINPCGEVLTQTDPYVEVVWRDVSLDFVIAHTDFNYRIPEAVQARYGDKVSLRSYPSEAFLLIEPQADGLTSAQIQKECAFESVDQYSARHRTACEQLRQGKPATPQQAAHGARPQYSK
ncbi:MAG TPA: carbon-nitrogen hydrolase family protein [Planctomycetota bacterium]|jgi:predicted amidohydrolase